MTLQYSSLDLEAKKRRQEFFERQALKREQWRRQSWYYYKETEALLKFLIPPNKKILEIGCALGDLLASVEPSRGVGIDISGTLINLAREKYPNLKFHVGDAESLELNERFDYIIVSDTVGSLVDLWRACRSLRSHSLADTRVIVTFYNHLWEPLLLLGEKVGSKMPVPKQNWLTSKDLKQLFKLNGFEVVREGEWLLMPRYIPLVSRAINRVLAHLPILNRFCMVNYIVFRPDELPAPKELSFSLIVPCRNEKGNIEPLLRRLPKVGSTLEVIFVDGGSSDGTVEEINRLIPQCRSRFDVKVIEEGKATGKAAAVRAGIESAGGDIVMIFDGDMSVEPEDLPKFYLALAENHADFINGSRLVYPMDEGAIRALNLWATRAFSFLFRWILGQDIEDPLCGAKAFYRKHWPDMDKARAYFGGHDPFGDFDFLLAAAKRNLKIAEVPVRYRERVYGATKVRRFFHGWLLLKMCFFALWKFKFPPKLS